MDKIISELENNNKIIILIKNQIIKNIIKKQQIAYLINQINI